MAYIEVPGAETLTDAGTQIGNQFLRLPEHAPGSDEKRDEASDLTQLTGLLFLLLSGITPRQLLNSEGRKPHERRTERSALQKRSDLNLPWILRVFDRAFELEVSKRFQTAEELKAALVQPVAHKTAAATTQEMIQVITSHLKSPKGQQTAEDHAVLNRLGQVIYDSADPIRRMLSGISVGVGGFSTETAERRTNVNFYLNPEGDDSLRFTASIQGKVIGHDLTVEIVEPYQDELLRFPREELTGKEATVGNAVRDVLIRGLHNTLDGDGVVRRRYFRGVVYDNLEDAQAAAIRDQRPVFLIVFDSTKPKKSEIEHALGYFMQRQSTKDEVARHFVQAIVDVHRLRDRNLVPAEETLESCLWLVLDLKGRSHITESVYANPDEGAKRVHAAVQIIPRLLSEP
jgi:serine/threonine-protein kinase